MGGDACGMNNERHIHAVLRTAIDRYRLPTQRHYKVHQNYELVLPFASGGGGGGGGCGRSEAASEEELAAAALHLSQRGRSCCCCSLWPLWWTPPPPTPPIHAHLAAETTMLRLNFAQKLKLHAPTNLGPPGCSSYARSPSYSA